MEKRRQHRQRLHTYPNQGVSNLWQLFEGPSQFEEFGDVAALRVVLTRAPRLCKKTFFLLLRCNVKLYRHTASPTFQTRWMEFNEEFCLACCLHNGFDSFKFDPGPLYASIHICARQIHGSLVSVLKGFNRFDSDWVHSTCFGAGRRHHSDVKRGKDGRMVTCEDVVSATWLQTNAHMATRTIKTTGAQNTAQNRGSLPGKFHRMWLQKKTAGCKKQLGYYFYSLVFRWNVWKEGNLLKVEVETTHFFNEPKRRRSACDSFYFILYFVHWLSFYYCF